MKRLSAAILVLALLFVAGCDEKSKAFDEADNGQEFTVPHNRVFKIKLPSNPTTGYSWFFDNLDTHEFKLMDVGFSSLNDEKLIGAPRMTWWEIKPLTSGAKNIRLLYFRPWEGKGTAVKEYKISLVIK